MGAKPSKPSEPPGTASEKRAVGEHRAAASADLGTAQTILEVRSASAAVEEPQPADGAPLWAGKIRLAEALGWGGMAVVHRGVDVELRRELAVKVVAPAEGEPSEDDVARFVDEAQITAQLEHPNIVPVHQLGVDPEGRIFFSMKLVRGQSLENILAKREEGDEKTLAEFGLRRLLDVFLAVCQAIEYAHARGVIHRDLKPANIMVGDFGEVLVMDWGVAKVRGRKEPPPETREELPERGSEPAVSSLRRDDTAHKTVIGTVLGTPAYMSPEQARGDVVDERSDAYSLGAILYEILCGKPPFEGDELLVVLTRVMVDEPTPPSQVKPGSAVPEALEELSLRLLAKDRDHRNITLPQIRSHIQDYIEGISRGYRAETLGRKVGWGIGGALLFAFLVWYLTGQSAARLLAPEALLNAFGWFLLVMIIGYPLWASVVAFRHSQSKSDHFAEPGSDEHFVSAFAAHRTFSAAIAPLPQLAFLGEMAVYVVPGVITANVRDSAKIAEVLSQLAADWYHALNTVLVFLFAYLYLLASEVRYARNVGCYERLTVRSGWESLWPFFLIITLLLSVGTMSLADWTLQQSSLNLLGFLQERIVAPPLDIFGIVKTLVFQGTFLVGLLGVTLLVSYPFPEVLAALRLPYQPADEASVRTRREYFLRSLSVFQVARANFLYGGAMIASLTAMSVLAAHGSRPLVEEILYILGPSFIGFAGYFAVRSYVLRYLASAPAVVRLREARLAEARAGARQAARRMIEAASWRTRLAQFIAPGACLVIYLAWMMVGERSHALSELIRPATSKEVLLVVPYVLLIFVILVRDHVHLFFLKR